MRPPARALLCLALWLSPWTAGPGATPAGAEPGSEPDWSRAGDDAAALLSRLIRVDTTNPPGNELRAALLIDHFLSRTGIESQIFEPAPGRGSLIARLPANVPRASASGEAGGAILLLSHLDVVAADPEAWTFPPFSGAIQDGLVFGRGALDDKGQAAVFAVALSLLAREATPRSRDIVLCAAADEETGGPRGVPWLIEHHWQTLGPPAFVWNEGGGSTRLPMLDGEVLNAVATTEKRALWLRLVAEGEGGHGSQPLADAASDRLVRAVARVIESPLARRLTPTVAETFARIAPGLGFPRSWLLAALDRPLALRLAGPSIESSRITHAMIRDTIAVTGLEAGLQHNLIPRRAEALLDVRLLPDADAAQFLAELEKRIDDPKVRIENTLAELPPMVPASPWKHPFFETLEAVLAKELPGSITAPFQSTGSTDSLYFRQRGIPAYGYLPALLSDDLNASIHGLDERVPVAELERAVRITWRVLRRLVISPGEGGATGPGPLPHDP